MVRAGDVHNDSPTSANKFGGGAAPSATLGLVSDLGVCLPFGSLAYHLVRGAKADDKNELVAILGLNHEGAGYRALRVSDNPGGSVFVFQDTKAHAALGTARSLFDRVNAGLSPASASFVAHHFNCGESIVGVDGEARGGHLGNVMDSAADVEAEKVALPPRMQTMGESPAPVPGDPSWRGSTG